MDDADTQAKTAVRVKPSSYQPSKAELEEDMSVDATPEALADCIGRSVAVTKPQVRTGSDTG